MNNLVSRGSAFAAILALALIPAAAQQPRAADDIQRIEIRSQAIEAFDPREPARTRFGALTFRGGLILESPHRDFGGVSGLRVAADGAHFLSVTDKGHWLRGRIVYRGKVPIAIADAEMAPILGPDGRPLKAAAGTTPRRSPRTAAAVYVGIERVNQIVRFDIAKDGLRARGRPIAVPPGMKLLPHNQSIECLEVAPKGGPLAGTLISISERGLDTARQSDGLSDRRFGGGVFSLKRTDDFDVSDCAATPDGKLLVLERRFSWARGLAIRIRSVPLERSSRARWSTGPS